MAIIGLKPVLVTGLLAAALPFTCAAEDQEKITVYLQSDHGYAEVTHVEPIYRRVSKQQPYQHCWYEPVKRKARYRRKKDSYAPEIVGTLLGGAIGHAVGHKKRNKQIGVLLGGIIGGSIAHRIDNDRHANRSGGRLNRSQPAHYRQQQRCETQYRQHSTEIIDGYNVSYTYQGQHYRTVMKEAPGDKIAVAVSVKPV